MHHRRRSKSAGPTSGTTGGARAAQEFVGCAGAVPPPERFDSRTSKHVVEQRQKHCTLRWLLQRDEGPHYNVVPRSNREKRLRLLPANNKTSFFIRPTRGWNQVVPTQSLVKFPVERVFHCKFPIGKYLTPEFLWSSTQRLPSARHGWWLSQIQDDTSW